MSKILPFNHGLTKIAFLSFLIMLHNIYLNLSDRAFCVGSLDSTTRVFAAQRFRNLIVYSLSTHKDSIVGAFFEENSLNVSLKCNWNQILAFSYTV